MVYRYNPKTRKPFSHQVRGVFWFKKTNHVFEIFRENEEDDLMALKLE